MLIQTGSRCNRVSIRTLSHCRVTDRVAVADMRRVARHVTGPMRSDPGSKAASSAPADLQALLYAHTGVRVAYIPCQGVPASFPLSCAYANRARSCLLRLVGRGRGRLWRWGVLSGPPRVRRAACTRVMHRVGRRLVRVMVRAGQGEGEGEGWDYGRVTVGFWGLGLGLGTCLGLGLRV
jgi:hypothetical protein